MSAHQIHQLFGTLASQDVFRVAVRVCVHLCLSVAVSSGLCASAGAQDRGPTGTVTLTRTDYDRLLDLAARRTRDPERAPVAAALTRADLRVRVAGNVARATIAVDGQVFHAGVVKVPLLSGATLLDA